MQKVSGLQLNANTQVFQESTLIARFETVRAATLAIAAPLSPEDMVVQSMLEASPIKWHLAHTSWFFETFILIENLPAYEVFNPHFKTLFNSYYVSLGACHPRPQRGMLTRPSLSDILDYRKHVDMAIHHLLEQVVSAQVKSLLELGLQHEQQHQELMLTDIKHLFFHNPLFPAYLCTDLPSAAPASSLEWIHYEAATRPVGHAGEGFHFDNETPRYLTHIPSFAITKRLITNGEYLAFIEAGAYRQTRWWLAEAVDWINREAVRHPLYWHYQDGKWFEFTLHGLVPLQLDSPICHINYFEADAFARFAGARLPTEFEWEHVAAEMPVLTANPHRLHPQGGGEGGSHQPLQLYAQVWQWTCSAYAAYPGFSPSAGAVGEYNGKFMVNQYVLRGSSAATPRGHARPTYRNFFPTGARWQFTGLRLAKSL